MTQKEYCMKRAKEQLNSESDSVRQYRRFTDEQLLSAKRFGLENPCWKITIANSDFYLDDDEYIKDLRHNLEHAKAMYLEAENYIKLVESIRDRYEKEFGIQ